MSETDALLYHAYSIHQSKVCQCCGQWAEIAHDPDTDGWWEVETVTCYAGAELQRWGKDNKEPEPGTLRHVRLDPAYRKRSSAGS